jgi:uncharacterized membrane protein YfcA
VVETAAALVVVGVAAAVKGAVGFGFPMIAVPTLAAVVGARTAVVVVTIPSLVANVLILRSLGRQPLDGWFLRLCAGLLVGTAAGALLVTRVPGRVLSLVLGLMALGVLAQGALRTPKGSGRDSAWRLLAPVAGLVAGLLGGATDIFSPVLAAFLSAVDPDRDRFVFRLTVLFLLGGVLQIATFARAGLYTPDRAWTAALACLPMLAGTWAGIRLRPRLQTETFQRSVRFLILLAALNLVRQGLLG